MFVSEYTPASMFRLIDKFEASVGIDEADGGFKENYELISLVNGARLKFLDVHQRRMKWNCFPFGVQR